jgi:uncharacterized membrane protein
MPPHVFFVLVRFFVRLIFFFWVIWNRLACLLRLDLLEKLSPQILQLLATVIVKIIVDTNQIIETTSRFIWDQQVKRITPLLEKLVYPIS